MAVALTALSIWAAGADPASGATLDPSHARAVDHVVLAAGLAEVRLDDGWLFPSGSETDDGIEMVFVGSGRLVLEPPDEIEAGQLDLFTGRRRLDERFEQAVFLVASAEARHALLDRPAGSAPEAVQTSATELHDAWTDGPEQRVLGVEAARFRHAAGDPFYEAYFLGLFDGERVGQFIYAVEPEEAEQVTLGQFVPLELTKREARQVQRELHREQRRGRLMEMELEDLGQWDTWLSSSLANEGPGGAVEAVHYRLEVDVQPRRGELEATAWVELESQAPTLGVELGLHGDLVVRSVMAEDATELEWVRNGASLTVILPELLAEGERTVVRVDYGGALLDEQGHDRYALRGTTSWYPGTGWRGRATFDATFRWPTSLRLVAGGRRVEFGVDAERRQRGRFVEEFPSAGFSFEIGDFERTTRQMGDVEVVFARHRMTSSSWEEETAETIAEALEYFESIFGPYPLDHLTVVDVDRGYYQGLLGFLTLAGDRRSTVAHELAHQWWGNLVGWVGYRDQWISEAMANYAAKQFLRSREDPEYGGGPADGWQSYLSERDADGRPIESYGPVVLGSRLSSSKNPGAYYDIVYRKGALVLETLARTMGAERFHAALAATVRAVDNEPISTEAFIEHLERATGADLEWFTRQYVHGTGVPEIVYEIEPVATDDGRWELRGNATQAIPRPFRYRIVERTGGALDVEREVIDDAAAERSFLVVPMQLSFEPEKKRKRSKDGVKYLTGHVVLRGLVSDFVVGGLPRRPERIWLDLDEEVFGLFLDATTHPKRAAWVEGRRALVEGRTDDAERRLEAALEQPIATGTRLEAMSKSERREEERILDALTLVDLARIALDRGDLESARHRLEASRDTHARKPGFFSWGDVRDLADERRIAEARLAILSEQPDEALRDLRRDVDLDELDSLGSETLIVLGIAAHGSGDTEMVDAAAEALGRRGVDLDQLSNPGG